ncbi:MAG: CHAT domain-containing protein [Anaerolineae bacterium]
MREPLPELRVEVERVGNRYVATVSQSNGQEIARHEFQHETSSLMPLSLFWEQERARVQGWIAARSEVASQGRQLYRYLFGSGKGVQDYLEAHLEGPVQLTLAPSPEAATLLRLPWEYLYDGSDFLCLSGRLLLSRRPDGLRTVLSQPTALPLRILAILAVPKDQATYEVSRELSLLQEALDAAVRTDTIDFDVLSEPTSLALLEAMQRKPYHVLHFLGHGSYRLSSHQGFLCFEDEVGATEFVSGAQLPRFLHGGWPRVVVTAACPSAPIGAFDAFTGVAVELLRHDVPSVVTIPLSLDPASSARFFRALYERLAEGHTLIESLHQGRQRLGHERNGGRKNELPPARGTIALYERTAGLRLIATEPASEGTPILSPEPPAPVGLGQEESTSPIDRKEALQAVLKALRGGARIFDIWGSEGVGKGRFASQVIARISPRPTASLVIPCSDLVEPLTMLFAIAEFWRAVGSREDRRAADLLLDANQPLSERARQAQELLARKRYAYLFKDLDAVVDYRVQTSEHPSSQGLQELLLGLLSVSSRSLFFFTGARRWPGLTSVQGADIRQICLPLLLDCWAIQLMLRWPELRRLTLPEKHRALWHIGGHPKALQLLAGHLGLGEEFSALLERDDIPRRSTEAWISYLIRRILHQLDPGEREVLQAAAILQHPFSADLLSDLTPIAIPQGQPLIERWCRLGLIEPVEWGDETRYSVHAIVRREVQDRLTASELAELHRRAAATYGGPTVDAVRRQILARNITGWSQERIEWLARDPNGMLGIQLRHQEDPGQTQELLERALAWQHHLMEAGQVAGATQIVKAIAPTLNRQGQRDLSRALLKRALLDLDELDYTTEVEDLAELRLEEGSLTEALQVYEELYKSLHPVRAGIQRARVLLRASHVHQKLGHLETAIDNLRLALRTMRASGDEEGEAECLYRLARCYRGIGEAREALVYSQAAKEHYELLAYPYGLALVEREQGFILKDLNRPRHALARFAASLHICRQLDDEQYIAENLIEIGLLFEELGQIDMAIQAVEEALEHYKVLRGPDHGEVLLLLEQLYARKQRLDEALARYRAARESRKVNSQAP